MRNECAHLERDCLYRKSENHDYLGWGAEVFGKIELGWHITEKIRNIISVPLAVFKPCETLRNHFQGSV